MRASIIKCVGNGQDAPSDGRTVLSARKIGDLDFVSQYHWLATVWDSGVQVTRKRVVVSKEALKRAGRRSTKASAKLENREVPDDHVRSEAVQRNLMSVRARERPIVCNRSVRTSIRPATSAEC